MAHMARVAGTDYAVAGGKTLIDGTAYSVVATREVENSKLISGRVTSRTTGNYSNVTIAISNSSFDWSKFKVNMLALKADESLADYSRVIALAIAEDQLISSKVSGKPGVATSATLDTSTNGVLKVTITFSGDYQHTCQPFDWWIALEAKT